MLSVNDWIVINSITYDIHYIDSFDKMRTTFLQQLKSIIDFDSADFFVVDNIGSSKLCSPVGINETEEFMNQYIETLKEIDYSKGLQMTGRNISYRESDIIDDEIRVNTRYYKKMYESNNWHFSLHLNLAFNDQFLGVVSFYREKGKPDYEYREIFILDMIKMHLALRCNREVSKWSSGKLPFDAFIKEYNLTSREEMILEYILNGKTAKEISLIAGISQNTVNKHISNIYEKAGINSRAQLLNKIV